MQSGFTLKWQIKVSKRFENILGEGGKMGYLKLESLVVKITIVFCFVIETGFHYVVSSGLELNM